MVINSKKIVLKLYLFIFSFLSFISLSYAQIDLRVGDVILLPLKCQVCRYISDETGSKYTHIGIVLNIDNDTVYIAESFGRVRSLSLSDFLNKLPENESAAIYRSFELDHLYSEDNEKFVEFSLEMRTEFLKKYIGAGYDPFYLWDNLGYNEREIYYCSELVTKMLNKYLFSQIETVPMTFRQNWAFWYKYFRGDVPEGKLGIPPQYFATSKLFYFIDFIQ